MQEGATIGDVGVHARIGERLVRVQLHAKLVNARIDLHGVHARRALAQGDSDVAPTARTYDEHVTDTALVGDAVVEDGVDGRPLETHVDRHDRLVWDAVGQHADCGVRLSLAVREVVGDRLDLVVRRPDVACQRPLSENAHDHRETRQDDPARPRDQKYHRDGQEHRPDDGRGGEKRHDGEEHRAQQAAQQVVAVGLQARELQEALRHEQPEPGHDRGDSDEHEGKRDDRRGPGRADGREVDEIAAGAVDANGKHADDDDERGEQQRGPPRGAPAGLGHEEPEPDAEERPQKHDVGEVRQVQQVGTEPTDQQQLGEEHQGAGRHQSGADRGKPHHRGPVSASVSSTHWSPFTPERVTCALDPRSHCGKTIALARQLRGIGHFTPLSLLIPHRSPDTIPTVCSLAVGREIGTT